jgi:hypothetical protein
VPCRRPRDKLPSRAGIRSRRLPTRNPPFGDPLNAALAENPAGRLDLSCVAAQGIFSCDAAGACTVVAKLIARLQDRRYLGHRLLSRGPSAGSQDPYLSSGPAAGLYRAGLAFSQE